MSYFDINGRRIITEGMRVFSDKSKGYYALRKSDVDYASVLKNSVQYGDINSDVSEDHFKARCEQLKREIQDNADFSNLLCGVHIPFICKKIEPVKDFGKKLESIELPNYQRAFNAKFPQSHFKAVLQSNSQLAGNVNLDSRSRYQHFVEACQEGIVVGWYFPQALQEFDVESQRKQMVALPESKNICLSGGIDTMAALIGTPDLLINEEAYAPILCFSSYVHVDPRLILLIKSYGPHMEFWCMTQMLTKDMPQVSEQWTGGLTIYSELNS